MPSTLVKNIYIKNMVCDRCIKVVKDELQKSGFDVRSVRLGEAELGGKMSSHDVEKMRTVLEENGFELIEDKNAKTIEAIKRAIIQFVHHSHESGQMKKYSDYIARIVGRDYHSLSHLFSSVENVTIEQYIIKQKIERVKELMKYDERSLSEISYVTGYSSVQHLSRQFKNVTGMTPSQFKALSSKHHRHHRRAIDKIV